MTVEKESDNQLNPEDCVKLPILYIKIAGLWSIDHSNSMLKLLFSAYIKYVQAVLCFFIFGICMKFYCDDITIEEKMELLIFSIAQGIIQCKFYVFRIKEKELQCLFDELKRNFFIHKPYITTESRKIINSTLRITRKLNIIYALFINFSIIFYIGVAPFFISSHNIEENSGNNVTLIEHRRLPYPIWVPIDVDTSRFYHVVYIMLLLMSQSTALLLMAIQCSIFTTLLCLKGQFQLLCDSLRNLPKNTVHRLEANIGNFVDYTITHI